MKVQEQTYLKKPVLVLLPETLAEKDMLKRCLGTKSPLRVIGVLKEVDSPDLKDSVVLWNDSHNTEEQLPEWASSGPEVRTIKKRAHLKAFMHGLRRYINNIIDYRLNEERDYGSLGQYEDKISEASQDLQKILKPLFEEEVH